MIIYDGHLSSMSDILSSFPKATLTSVTHAAGNRQWKSLNHTGSGCLEMWEMMSPSKKACQMETATLAREIWGHMQLPCPALYLSPP